MSYSVDVNVLLYASDAGSPYHARAASFLAARPADLELFCLAWPTVMAYLRIGTHPSIFATPLTPAEALANVQALLALPRVRPIGEVDGFLDVFSDVTRQAPARGNQVPDAHLAVLLRQHDVTTLYTRDADFRRFDFLTIRDPLQ